MSYKHRCRVCGYPPNQEFTVILGGRTINRKFLYCSQLCKNSVEWGEKMTNGFIIIVLSLIPIIVWRFWISLVFTLIGFGYMIYGKIIKPYDSEVLYIKEKKQKGYKVTLPLANSDLPPEKEGSVFEKVERKEKKVYSEILQTKVLECCYQSARLNDKYCICGRALEYPAET